jgi:hypothetical protein
VNAAISSFRPDADGTGLAGLLRQPGRGVADLAADDGGQDLQARDAVGA